MSFSSTIPTFTDENTTPQQILAENLSLQDLASLKRDDPFMYFSIPSVRNAVLFNKDVDESVRSFIAEEGAANAVTRQSRLTFEFHNDKVIHEMISTNLEDFDSDEDIDDQDDIYSYLLQLERETGNPGDDDIISVPTFTEESTKPQQICTKGLSVQDLKSLKKNDPFLYYSIPEVRNSAIFNRSSATEMVLSSDSDSEDDMSHTVTRQSRIAFECHGDLLLEDLMDEIASGNHDDAEEKEDDNEDWIISFFEPSNGYRRISNFAKDKMSSTSTLLRQ